MLGPTYDDNKNNNNKYNNNNTEFHSCNSNKIISQLLTHKSISMHCTFGLFHESTLKIGLKSFQIQFS